MSEFELLVGADGFWARAAGDIGAARDRVLVQAMTFEGDEVGKAVAAAIAQSPAAQRRVLIDEYTLWVINDRFHRARAARRDPTLQAEVRATRAMFDALVAAGVGLKTTNPMGSLLRHYPARNHKKMIVADNVAYIGGINFSDHNFAWRDFMVRIEGSAADFLAADFEATFTGESRPSALDLDGLRLLCLDGRTNASAFGEVIALIEGATHSITVVSPYLTFPFVGALGRAARRGVRVRLITPLANNKPLVRDYLLAAAGRNGFDVVLLQKMIHLKGMLVDDSTLVVGSSNFDFASLAAEEEIVALVRDRGLIEAFRRRVIEPADDPELVAEAWRPSVARALTAHTALKLAQLVARSARGAPRGARTWKA